MKKFLLIFSVVFFLPFLIMAQGSSSAPESWLTSYAQTYEIFVQDAQSPSCNPWDVSTGMSYLWIVHTDTIHDTYYIDDVEIPDSTWIGVFYEDSVTNRYCCGYKQYIKSTTTYFPILAPVCDDNVYPINGFWVPESGGGHPSSEIIALHVCFYINGQEYWVTEAEQYAFSFPPPLDGKYYRGRFYTYHTMHASSEANVISVSGNVVDNNGNPLNGVEIAFEGASSAITNSEGFYSANLYAPYTGKANAILENYSFIPEEIEFINLSESLTDQNFVGTQLLDSVVISGNVTYEGNPLAGVNIIFTNYTPVITDDEGLYSIKVAYGYSGMAVPVLEHYKFTPMSVTYNNVKTNLEDQNYVATYVHDDVVISGYVLDEENNPLANIAVESTNNPIVVTNSEGFYSIIVNYNYTGIVSPKSEDYEFTPESRQYIDLQENVIDQNYIASEIVATYNLSGVVFINDGSKAMVPAEGAVVFCGDNSVTVGANGEFNFVVRHGWAGIVSAYLLNYYFDPVAVPPIYDDEDIVIEGDEITSPWVYENTPIMHIIYGGFIINEFDFHPTVAGIEIFPGDWIGVFDGDICLGASQWNGNVENFYVTAFGKTDNSTEGQLLTYKIASNLIGHQVIYDVPAENVSYLAIGSIAPTIPFPNSDDGTFKADGTSILLTMNADAETNTIEGKITFKTESGDPIKGASMLIGNNSVVKTNAEGFYLATVLKGWSGIVKPYLRGYYFTPEDRTYTDIAENQINQDYIAAYELHTISGTITDVNGNPLNHIAVRIYEGSELLKYIYTDSLGYYAFDSVDFVFKGRILPELAGYYFEPYSFKIINIYSNVENVDFVAIKKQLPIEWENDLSNHGSLMHNLIGYYTYPYDSETYRFIPQLNGVNLVDGDWIGAFYWNDDEDRYVCAGASEWFSEEVGFYLTMFGKDEYGDGFEMGQEVVFGFYSRSCQKTIIADEASFYTDTETVIYDAVEQGIYWSELTFNPNKVSEIKAISAEDNTLRLDIYGYVLDNNGNALENVNVFNHETNTILTTTDNTGYYFINDIIVYGGSDPVTIAPALEGYVFEPVSYTTVPPVVVNIEQDFVGTPADAPWVIDPNHGNQAHTILVPDSALIALNGANLNYGNYIGVFYNDENGNPRCGGYMCWTGVSGAIVVFSDEVIFSPDTKDGFEEGEAFQWRIYSFEDDSTRIADAQYVIGQNIGGLITIDGFFHHDGLSLVSSVVANDYIESNIVSTLPSGVYCGDSQLPVTLNIVPVNYMFNDITYHWIVTIDGVSTMVDGQTYILNEIPEYNVPITFSAYVQKGSNIYESNNEITYVWYQLNNPSLVSDPPAICTDSEITLIASVEGGSGNFNYIFMHESDTLYEGNNNQFVYQVPEGFIGYIPFSVMISEATVDGCDPVTADVVVISKGTIGEAVICNLEGDTVNNVVTCDSEYTLVAKVENVFSEPFCLYQWQRRGAGVDEWYSIYNAKNKTYKAAQYSEEPTSYYRVIINIDGCDDQIAIVYATVQWSNYERTVTIFGDQTICEDTEVEPLSSIVEGGPCTYQWYVDGEIIEDATEPTYLPVKSGEYYLEVDNYCGQTFNSNIVTVVIVPNADVYAGEDQILCKNTIAYKIADAYANGCETYYWSIFSGNGELSNNNEANPYYYPAADDEEVVLMLTGISSEPCSVIDMDVLVLEFVEYPEITSEIVCTEGDGVLCNYDVNNFMIDLGSFTEQYTCEWLLLPSNIAGTIEGTENTAVVFWNEDFVGDAQVIVKLISCGGSHVEQIANSFTRNLTPVILDDIQGLTKVPLLSNSTNYYLPVVFNATSYEWTIDPAEAGTIIANNNSMVVEWSDDWTGFATISVTAENECGVSAPKTLEIHRSADYISEGINNNEIICTVYPNPNNGTFTLNVDNISGNYEVEIYNYAGQLVYRNSYSESAPVIVIPSASSGVYFVRLTNNNNTAVKRVVVR